uniref:Uncharacterized protein n=1 Tax=Lygus hesperus TaxID=30085 RepID=A0A0K8SA48_LYGHE
MMGQQRTGLRMLAGMWRRFHKQTPMCQNRTQQIGCVSGGNSRPLPPSTPTASPNIQPIRNFSLIPGKGDCKKKEQASKCPKCPKPKAEGPKGGCCPHPPPACASVCRSCPPEKKPSCPLPTRPPQPCHCPLVMEVKHKPGQCPGPCDEEKKDC